MVSRVSTISRPLSAPVQPGASEATFLSHPAVLHAPSLPLVLDKQPPTTSWTCGKPDGVGGWPSTYTERKKKKDNSPSKRSFVPSRPPHEWGGSKKGVEHKPLMRSHAPTNDDVLVGMKCQEWGEKEGGQNSLCLATTHTERVAWRGRPREGRRSSPTNDMQFAVSSFSSMTERGCGCCGCVGGPHTRHRDVGMRVWRKGYGWLAWKVGSQNSLLTTATQPQQRMPTRGKTRRPFFLLFAGSRRFPSLFLLGITACEAEFIALIEVNGG
jgi:hypothetical protein